MTRLPAGWRSTPLRDLGTWYGGGTPSKGRPEFWAAGTVPWLSPKDMGPDVVSRTQDLITEDAVAGSSVRLVPPGSVAVVVRSGILERKVPIAVVPMATTLNQDMKAVVPHSHVDPRWIAWALRAKERQVLDRCRKAGTTVASLDTKRLMDQELPLPPLDEQRRIVDLLEDHLSRLDAAEATLGHADRSLLGLRERVVLDALTGERVMGSRHEDIPAAEGVEDGELTSLPEGWRWLRLRDVAEVVGGVTKDAGRQGDPAFVEVPYLRVANVQRGRLVLDKITRIRVAQSKADALRLKVGDVLLNEGGDRDKLGRGWVWEGQIEDCIHQNHVFRARVDIDVLHPKLLSWAANTIGGRWCERNGKQSVNLASISLNKIRLMPVPVPPTHMQETLVERIEEALMGCDRLQVALAAQRRRLATLRRSLLEAAFSGRLRSTPEGLHV